MANPTNPGDWHSRVYRSGEAAGRRRPPPKSTRDAVLERQENRCLYCGGEFGGWASRHGKLVAVRIAWDHSVPFSYLQRNPDSNWVAACTVCNGIKSNLIFDSLIEAQDFIKHQRHIKGYR